MGKHQSACLRTREKEMSWRGVSGSRGAVVTLLLRVWLLLKSAGPDHLRPHRTWAMRRACAAICILEWILLAAVFVGGQDWKVSNGLGSSRRGGRMCHILDTFLRLDHQD